MQMYKLVSAQHAVQNIIEDTGLDLTHMKPEIIRWILYIDREIGAFHQYDKQRCVLKADGCHLNIPENAVVLLPGILQGDHGTDCEATFCDIRTTHLVPQRKYNGSFNPSSTFIVIDGVDVDMNTVFFDYHVINNRLRLPGDYDGDPFTLEYLAYKTDDNGWPLVRESNLEAANYYVQYKLMKRGRWRKTEWSFGPGDVQQAIRDYSFYVRKARADAGEPTEQEWAEMREMINNPLTGLFASYYLYPESYYTV